MLLLLDRTHVPRQALGLASDAKNGQLVGSIGRPVVIGCQVATRCHCLLGIPAALTETKAVQRRM